MGKIVILRHSLAAPAVDGDINRPLTDDGKARARLTRHFLKEPDFALVIASPCLRTQQTALLVANREADVTDAWSLYGPAPGPELEAMLAGPVAQTWQAHPEIWEAFAREMVDEITQHTTPVGDRLVVGHWPFLNALIWGLTRDTGLRDLEFKECQGVLIDEDRFFIVDPTL